MSLEIEYDRLKDKIIAPNLIHLRITHLQLLAVAQQE